MIAVAVPCANGERNTLEHFVVAEGLMHTLGDDPVFARLCHRATYLSSRRSMRLWPNESTRQMTQ